MPGADLEQIESDRAYLASVKVAVGPFTTSYKGRVEFAEVDESLHRARLTAEGQERGGGAAHGSMVSSLRTVEEGTEVVVDVSVEGTSRIVHLGLGLTQNLAQELFGQFVTRVKERLEARWGRRPAAKRRPALRRCRSFLFWRKRSCDASARRMGEGRCDAIPTVFPLRH